MTALRLGTRSSDLALAQTRLISAQLAALKPSCVLEEAVITTHGDLARDQPMDAPDWPKGGFVGAIEQALLRGEIDLAVHSLKDLPATPTEGLEVIAIPARDVAHDVLITRERVALGNLPRGLRIGTGSPRRAAQMRQLGEVDIIPIRGNVPTRLAKVGVGELDGVVLAAAGVRRLGLAPTHVIDLPPERFPPAPGQGALAVQVRADDAALRWIASLDHEPTRAAVEAERCLLRALGTGCAVPLGALGEKRGETISLAAQLFSADGTGPAEAEAVGPDPQTVAARVAIMLREQLRRIEGSMR